VAVIVAVPSATAVTRPDEETVATDAADELHVTLAPLIVAPFWSLTVAESWDVSPSDEKLKVVADSVTDVAVGVDTSIESGLVAVCASPLVTLAVNSLVPAAVGVPEIVEPTRDSPAGNVPALIDHEYVPSAPAALNCWLYSLSVHAVGSEVVDTDKASVQVTAEMTSPIAYATDRPTAQRAICCASTILTCPSPFTSPCEDILFGDPTVRPIAHLAICCASRTLTVLSPVTSPSKPVVLIQIDTLFATTRDKISDPLSLPAASISSTATVEPDAFASNVRFKAVNELVVPVALSRFAWNVPPATASVFPVSVPNEPALQEV
jgi:hypothetical protein